jgi:hypothetical protein
MASSFKQLTPLGTSRTSGGSSLETAANMWSPDATISSNPYAQVKLPTIKQPKAPTQKELKAQQLSQQLSFAGQFTMDAVNNMINDNSFINGTADQRTQLFENYSNNTIPEFLNNHPLTQSDPMFKASVLAQTQQALQNALSDANKGIGGTSIVTSLRSGLDNFTTMAKQWFNYGKLQSLDPNNISTEFQNNLKTLNKQYERTFALTKSALDNAKTPEEKAKAQADYDRYYAQYNKERAVIEELRDRKLESMPKSQAEAFANLVRIQRESDEFQRKLAEEDPNFADIQKQTQVNMQDGGFTKNLAGMWGARGGNIALNYFLQSSPTMLATSVGAVGGPVGIAAASGAEVQAEVLNQIFSDISNAPLDELMKEPVFAKAFKNYKDMGVADPEASARGYLANELVKESNAMLKAFGVGATFAAAEPINLLTKGSLVNKLLSKGILGKTFKSKASRVAGGTLISQMGEGIEEVAGASVANEALGKPLTEDWQEQFFPAFVSAGPLAAAGGTVNALRGDATTEQQGTNTEPTTPSETNGSTTPPAETSGTTETSGTNEHTGSESGGDTIIGNPFYRPAGDEQAVNNAGDIANRIRERIESARERLTAEGNPLTIGNLTVEEQNALAEDISALKATGVQNAEYLVNDMLNSFTPEKRRNSGKLKAGDVLLSTTDILNAYASRIAESAAQGTMPTAVAPTEPTTTDTATETETEKATTVAPQAATGSLQTRGVDRASPASISQMQAIAANPIPERLITDNVGAQNGAPVVTDVGGKIADTQKGSKTIVQSGQKINGAFVSVDAQWAVVPASSLLVSHNADGIANADYDTNPNKDIHVVSGNGRSAGLTRSYVTNRAGNYKNELAKRAEQFGIDPAVVNSMSDPVLVRVIDEKDATPEFVRSANEKQLLGASSFNQAQLDAMAVDANGNRAIPVGYETDSRGNPTDDVLIRFMSIAIPNTEHLGYVDANGKPNGRLRDRFNAAVFQAAYEDQSLFNTIYESEQEGMRNIATALKKAAGSMLALADAGKYDLRQYIIAAVMRVVDGKSKGMSINEIASLTELVVDDPTYEYSVRAVLMMFRDNNRSADAIASVLRDFAARERSAYEYEQSAALGGDLFATDAPSPQSIFNTVFNVSETIGGQQDAAGRGNQGATDTDSQSANTQQADTEQAGQQDTAQSDANGTATESTGTSGTTREEPSAAPDNVPPTEPAQDTGDRVDSRPGDTVPTTTGEITDTGAGGNAGTAEQRNGTDTGTGGNDETARPQTPIAEGKLTQEQFKTLSVRLDREADSAKNIKTAYDSAIAAAKVMAGDKADDETIKATATIIAKVITGIARVTDDTIANVYTTMTRSDFFVKSGNKALRPNEGGYTSVSIDGRHLSVTMNSNAKNFMRTFIHEMQHVQIYMFTNWVARTRGQERTEQQRKAIKDFADTIRACFTSRYKFMSLSDEDLVYSFSLEARSANKPLVSNEADLKYHEFMAQAAVFMLSDEKNFSNSPLGKLMANGNSIMQAIKNILDTVLKYLNILSNELLLDKDSKQFKEKVDVKGPLIGSNKIIKLYVRPIASYYVNGLPEPMAQWLHGIYDYTSLASSTGEVTDTYVDFAVMDAALTNMNESVGLTADVVKESLLKAFEDVRDALLGITEQQEVAVPASQATTPKAAVRNKTGQVATREAPTTNWSNGHDVSWLIEQPTTPAEQNIARQIISLDGKIESGAKHNVIARLIKNALDNGADPVHLRSMVTALADMYDQTGGSWIYVSEIPETDTATVQQKQLSDTVDTALVANLPTMFDNITDNATVQQLASSVDGRIFGNKFLEDRLPLEFPMLVGNDLLVDTPIESDVGLSDADALSNYIRAAVAEELAMLQEMNMTDTATPSMVAKAKDTIRKRVTAAIGSAVERNEVLLQEQMNTVSSLLSEHPEYIEAIDPANPVNPILTVDGLSDEDAVAIANGQGTVRTLVSGRSDTATADNSMGIVGSQYGTMSEEADEAIKKIVMNDLISAVDDGMGNSTYINMTDTPAYRKFVEKGSDRIIRTESPIDYSTATTVASILGDKLGLQGYDRLGSLVSQEAFNAIAKNIKQYEAIYAYNPTVMLGNIRYYVSAEIMSRMGAGYNILDRIERGTADENGGGYANASAHDIRHVIRTSKGMEEDIAKYQAEKINKTSAADTTMLHELQHLIVGVMCSEGNSEKYISPIHDQLKNLFIDFAHDVGIPVGDEFNKDAWLTHDYRKASANGELIPHETSSIAAEYYAYYPNNERATSRNKLISFLTSFAKLSKQPSLMKRMKSARTFSISLGDRNSLTYRIPYKVFNKYGVTAAMHSFLDAMYNQDIIDNEFSKYVTNASTRNLIDAMFNDLVLADYITQYVYRTYATNPKISVEDVFKKVGKVVNDIIYDIAKNNSLHSTSNNYAVMYRNGNKVSTIPTDGGMNIQTYVKLPNNYITVSDTSNYGVTEDTDYRTIDYKGFGEAERNFVYRTSDMQRLISDALHGDTQSARYRESVAKLRELGADALVAKGGLLETNVIMLNNPADISFDLFYQNENSDDTIIMHDITDIDSLADEPFKQQEAIDKAARIVSDIQQKNAAAAQAYISDFSVAEDTFLSQGLMDPISPNWWSKLCTNVREIAVDENAAMHSWTSLNLPTRAGGPGTSSVNMEFTLSRNRVLAARTELAETCIAPLNDYLKSVADELGIDVATVAKDLGTMYTDLHTLEAQRKQETELEQNIVRAQLLPTGIDKEAVVAQAQAEITMFRERQAGEDNGFKLYGGKPAKDCMEELTNLSQTYEGVADEAMVRFRDAFQSVVNIMLERGILSDEYRSYFGDFMYYMPLYTKTQYEDTKINDVVSLFSPKQDRSRKGSTSFALDAYTNLNWLVGRTANSLGSKKLGDELINAYNSLLYRYNVTAPTGSSKVNVIKEKLGKITITGVNGLYIADADYINAVAIGHESVPEVQQRHAQSLRDHAALLVRRVEPVTTADGVVTSVSKNYYVWFNEHDEDYIDTIKVPNGDGRGNKLINIVNHVDSNYKVHRALYEPFHLDNERETTNQKALNLLRKTTSGFGQLFTTYTAFFPIINAERDFVERATFANNKTYRDVNGKAVSGSVVMARMLKNGMSFGNAMRAAYTGKPENIEGIDGEYLTEMKKLGIMNSASISRMLDQNGSKLRSVIESKLPLLTDENERASLIKQLAGTPRQALRVWAEMLYTVPAYAMYKALRECNIAPRDSAYYVTEMMNLYMKSSLGRGLSYVFPFVSSIGNTATQLVNSIGLNLYTLSDSKVKRAENAKNTARTGLLMMVGIAGISALLPVIAIGLGDGDADEGYRIMDSKPLGSLNYIPIPVGNGKSIKLPLGFGLGPMMVQMAIGINRIMRNRTTIGSMMFDIADSLIRCNSPLTTPNYDTKNMQEWAGKVLYTITPTLLQPITAMALNKDYWGTPINRNKYANNMERASDKGSISTAQGWKAGAKWLYDTTGIDIAPESLRFLAKSYGAGPFSYVASYIDSQSQLSDPSHPSVRKSIGPVLSAMGASSFYDMAGNIDQQAFYSAYEFYDSLVRKAGVYDIIKGKGAENNAAEHRRNTLLQMGFSPLVANDVALMYRMDSELKKLYSHFSKAINEAYMRKVPIEEIRAMAATYYGQRNAYMHSELSKLNYYNNKIDKEADNLPPKQILDMYRSAYGNN